MFTITEKPISVLKMVDEILKLMKKENLKPKILNLALKEIFEQYLSSKKVEISEIFVGQEIIDDIYNLKEKKKELVVIIDQIDLLLGMDKNYLKNFIDTIKGDINTAASVDEGYWSIVVGVAAEESIRAGKPIKIEELLKQTG